MVDRRDSGTWTHTSTTDHLPVESGPRHRDRLRLPRLRVVPAIIAINGAVYVLWKLGERDSGIGALMGQHFLVSPQHLLDGHYWTLLTSVFSHYALWHLAINMLVLYSFGSLLERLLGPRLFTGFYLAAGLVGSLSHCGVSHFLMHDDQVSALGASGAVSGLLITFALLFPKEKLLLFGVVPVPALLGALGFVAIDIWGLTVQTMGGGLPIGHGAHLGGTLTGAAFFVAYLRPRASLLMARLARPRLRLEPEEAAELERLHRKVAEQGREQLTAEEQQFLADLRRRLQPPHAD